MLFFFFFYCNLSYICILSASLPFGCPSIGGNLVRDPLLRRRARAPAGPVLTSTGPAGGLGIALNGSSTSQGTENVGFWQSTNIKRSVLARRKFHLKDFYISRFINREVSLHVFLLLHFSFKPKC